MVTEQELRAALPHVARLDCPCCPRGASRPDEAATENWRTRTGRPTKLICNRGRSKRSCPRFACCSRCAANSNSTCTSCISRQRRPSGIARRAFGGPDRNRRDLPHYLHLHAEAILAAQPFFKSRAAHSLARKIVNVCGRSARRNHRLVATDHSPCLPEMKRIAEAIFARPGAHRHASPWPCQ